MPVRARSRSSPVLGVQRMSHRPHPRLSVRLTRPGEVDQRPGGGGGGGPRAQHEGVRLAAGLAAADLIPGLHLDDSLAFPGFGVAVAVGEDTQTSAARCRVTGRRLQHDPLSPPCLIKTVLKMLISIDICFQVLYFSQRIFFILRLI